MNASSIDLYCTKVVATARAAHADWKSSVLSERASVLRQLPALLGEHAAELHELLERNPSRRLADTIATELGPLAVACKWLVDTSPSVLRGHVLKRWGLNPFVGRLRVSTTREPVGVVFIIGPYNYPLFLVGVQILQAIFAGNSVVVKPAPGCLAVTQRLVDLLNKCGVPTDLITVIDGDADVVSAIIAARVDLVVLTGSSRTGRLVAQTCAQHLTPLIAELSGCDAMFLLPDADLDRVVRSIIFSLRLNDSATCMAVRRVIASSSTIDRLLPMLRESVAQLAPITCEPAATDLLQTLVTEAVTSGAVAVGDRYSPTNGSSAVAPVILDRVAPTMKVAQADIFGPVTSMIRADVDESDIEALFEAFLDIDRQCPYELSASIFGNPANAHQLARMLGVGTVTINDVIAPSVEPSIAFGGRNESGFGATRGSEGLRQMTREKSVIERRGGFLPHLDKPTAMDDDLTSGLYALKFASTFRQRLAAMRKIVVAARQRSASK